MKSFFWGEGGGGMFFFFFIASFFFFPFLNVKSGNLQKRPSVQSQ